jgi:hypothetical protein
MASNLADAQFGARSRALVRSAVIATTVNPSLGSSGSSRVGIITSNRDGRVAAGP